MSTDSEGLPITSEIEIGEQSKPIARVEVGDDCTLYVYESLRNSGVLIIDILDSGRDGDEGPVIPIKITRNDHYIYDETEGQ